MSDLGYTAAFIGARVAEDEEQARKLAEVARDAIEKLKDPRFLGREIPGWHAWPDVEATAFRALRDAGVKRTVVAACTRAAEADPDGPAGVLALAVMEAMSTEWEHKDRPFVPDWTIRPGVMVAEAMKARGMTADDLGARTYLRPEAVAGLLSGHLRIGGPTARLLADALGTSPDMWLNAQRLYDAAILRGATDTSGEHEQDAEGQ